MPWRQLQNGTLAALTDGNRDITFPEHGFPRFFMSGDGHRSPPFQWAIGDKNPLRMHFLQEMANGNLCVHVELHQDQVTAEAVPGLFQPLFGQQQIFGWELPFYKDLQGPMEESMLLAGDVGALPARDMANRVAAFDRELVRLHAMLHAVGNPATLTTAMAQHQPFRTYYQGLAGGQAAVAGMDDQYRIWLIAYHNAAMGLRTTVNNFIGDRINRNINLHPAKTHLITCGDAHILHNDLSLYVLIPATENGVVDPSNM